jgi:hypothetical protein
MVVFFDGFPCSLRARLALLALQAGLALLVNYLGRDA